MDIFTSTVLTCIVLNALHALIVCPDSVDINNIHNIQYISHFDPLYQSP